MNQELSTENRTGSVKSLLSADAYRKRFEEVLGSRAPQFAASIISASQTGQLAKCEPKSIIAAAMVAATLDLPIDRNLGFAHLVPYRGKDGVQVAQFQLGYKAYVQLALRSGQYQRMNATVVNAEAFGGYDEVGEPVIKWENLDDTKEAVGYVFAWKLINGFVKVVYWSKAKVEAHAKRFSQAVRNNKTDSPWFTDFDQMALKTLIKAGLSHWGILSIQMERALRHDQGAQSDVGGEVDYVDMEPSEPQDRPLPPEKMKGISAMRSQPQPPQQPSAESFDDAAPVQPVAATEAKGSTYPEVPPEPAKSSAPRRPGRQKDRAEPQAGEQSPVSEAPSKEPSESPQTGATGSELLGSSAAPVAPPVAPVDEGKWPRVVQGTIKLPNDEMETRNPNIGWKEHVKEDGTVVRWIKRCDVTSDGFRGYAFYSGRDETHLAALESGLPIVLQLSKQPSTQPNRPPLIVIDSAFKAGEAPAELF